MVDILRVLTGRLGFLSGGKQTQPSTQSVQLSNAEKERLAKQSVQEMEAKRQAGLLKTTPITQQTSIQKKGEISVSVAPKETIILPSGETYQAQTYVTPEGEERIIVTKETEKGSEVVIEGTGHTANIHIPSSSLKPKPPDSEIQETKERKELFKIVSQGFGLTAEERLRQQSIQPTDLLQQRLMEEERKKMFEESQSRYGELLLRKIAKEGIEKKESFDLEELKERGYEFKGITWQKGNEQTPEGFYIRYEKPFSREMPEGTETGVEEIKLFIPERAYNEYRKIMAIEKAFLDSDKNKIISMLGAFFTSTEMRTKTIEYLLGDISKEEYAKHYASAGYSFSKAINLEEIQGNQYKIFEKSFFETPKTWIWQTGVTAYGVGIGFGMASGVISKVAPATASRIFDIGVAGSGIVYGVYDIGSGFKVSRAEGISRSVGWGIATPFAIAGGMTGRKWGEKIGGIISKKGQEMYLTESYKQKASEQIFKFFKREELEGQKAVITIMEGEQVKQVPIDFGKGKAYGKTYSPTKLKIGEYFVGLRQQRGEVIFRVAEQYGERYNINTEISKTDTQGLIMMRTNIPYSTRIYEKGGEIYITQETIPLDLLKVKKGGYEFTIIREPYINRIYYTKTMPKITTSDTYYTIKGTSVKQGDIVISTKPSAEDITTSKFSKLIKEYPEKFKKVKGREYDIKLTRDLLGNIKTIQYGYEKVITTRKTLFIKDEEPFKIEFQKPPSQKTIELETKLKQTLKEIQKESLTPARELSLVPKIEYPEPSATITTKPETIKQTFDKTTGSFLKEMQKPKISKKEVLLDIVEVNAYPPEATKNMPFLKSLQHSVSETKLESKQKIGQGVYIRPKAELGIKHDIKPEVEFKPRIEQRIYIRPKIESEIKVEQRPRIEERQDIRPRINIRPKISPKTEIMPRVDIRPRIEIKPKIDQKTNIKTIFNFGFKTKPPEIPPLPPLPEPSRKVYTSISGMPKIPKSAMIVKVGGKKTLYADLLSVAQSQLKFGRATHLKPTKSLWQQAKKSMYLFVPTKELKRR